MQQRAAVWLQHLFTKHLAEAAPNTCIALKSNLYVLHEEGTVSSYCKFVNYSFKRCSADEVIAEMDTIIMQITKPWNNLPPEYVKAL